MYRNAVSFYKTSRPGLILVLLFSFTFLFGFLKASAPDVFYNKVQGKIDTAVFDIAYYQNHHKLTLRLNPSGLSLNQNYPTWWYAPRPKAAELKRGTPISLFASKLTFYGIQTDDRTIQPAWFDILHAYFNAAFPVFIILASLLLIIIYHYWEVVKNPFLCLPYAMGILILCFFWGSVNLIIFMVVTGFLLRYIIKKKNSQNTVVISDQNTATADQDSVIINEEPIIQDQDIMINEQNTATADQDSVIKNEETIIPDQDIMINEQNTATADQDSAIKNEETIIPDQDIKINEQNINDETPKTDHKNTTTDGLNNTGATSAT